MTIGDVTRNIAIKESLIKYMNTKWQREFKALENTMIEKQWVFNT